MKSIMKKIAAAAVVLSLCLATAACTPEEADSLEFYLNYARSYAIANGY
jgi:hypothetical protein